MFSTFFEKLSGFFDKHWLLRYFFPSLVFWAAGLAVYGAAQGITEPVDLWRRQPTEVQMILLAGALLWVTLSAYLLANFGTALIRLFEGYWERWPLTLLRRRRQGHYEKRFLYLEARLRAQDDSQERQSLEREWLLLFPQGRDRAKAVMPTRLGNIIKAAETYPLRTYGADAVIVWPRLAPFLPVELIEALNTAQTSMEVMLVLSALSFVFSVISCALLAALTLETGLFVLCTGGFLLAWICYRNSLHGALGYADLIRTAFDLHRGKLLDDLGLEKPSSPEEEREIWNDVTQWFYRTVPFKTARFKGAPVPGAEPPEPPLQTESGRALYELWVLALAIFQKPKPPAPSSPPSPPPQTAAGQQPAQTALQCPDRPFDPLPLLYFGTLLLLCLAGVGVMADQARQPFQAVALKRDVPAYRLLGSNDLKIVKLARSEAPDDAIPTLEMVAGKAYLAQPLPGETVLRKSGIRGAETPRLLAGRVAMGISATAATVLGGELRPGDAVSLAIAPAKDAPPPDSQCDVTSFQNLLTLDVKPPEKEGGSYVVILAVPSVCQATLASAAGRISLARAL